MKIFKSNSLIKASTTLLSFSLLVAPLFVSAQIQNPLRAGSNIPEFINTVLVYIVRVGGILATLSFIYAGFLYVEARGDMGKLGEAKNIFLNTCIGTAVLLGAQIIGTLIKGTVESLTGK